MRATDFTAFRAKEVTFSSAQQPFPTTLLHQIPRWNRDPRHRETLPSLYPSPYLSLLSLQQPACPPER